MNKLDQVEVGSTVTRFHRTGKCITKIVRETKLYWITQSGSKFRKSDLCQPGDRPWDRSFIALTTVDHRIRIRNANDRKFVKEFFDDRSKVKALRPAQIAQIRTIITL